VLIVAATRDNPDALGTWLNLGGAFFADATVTLSRRAPRESASIKATAVTLISGSRGAGASQGPTGSQW